MTNNYNNFYRKYRPQTFQTVVGQKTTVTILNNLVKTKKIHHAYLFSGMQGVGKTTLARIFARSINCLNYQADGYCQQCLVCTKNKTFFYDIIEIDGASHNGVEQILELQSNALLVPQISPYKIYIIDEVHMFSRSAFNAFLKLLEEPPHHVIFILATTEFYKIPQTIVSRCQHFVFSALSNKELVVLLTQVTQKEKLNFTTPALATVADFSNGSARDSLNLLEQIASFIPDKLVDAPAIHAYFGHLQEEIYLQFFHHLFALHQKNSFIMIEQFAKTNLKFMLLVEKMIIALKQALYGTLLYHQTHQLAEMMKYFKVASFCQWSSATLKTVLDLVLTFLPYFHYRQLKPQLLFEILVLNIFALLKKNLPKEGEKRWAMLILKNKITTKLSYLQKQWKDLTKYQDNLQLKPLVELFLLLQPVVISSTMILLQAKDEATKQKFNQFLAVDQLKELSHLLFDSLYFFLVLTSQELQELKEKYLAS